MKKLLLIASVGASLVAANAASAADGCGPGFHRGPYGHCRPNYGRGPGAVVVGPGLVVGAYHPGRGYWDGRRYWHNRYRWHGGWRYR